VLQNVLEDLVHTSHLDVTKERVRESPSPVRPWWNRLIRQRSVRFTVLGWLVANLLVLVTANGVLPFEWPSVADRSVREHLLDANLALLQVLLLMGVVFALTRKRNPAEVAARSPERVVARRETLLLLGYGILALIAGLVLPRMFGWHPFGLHLAGTIFGTHDHVEPAEALAWAAYNLIIYAAIPLIIFRRKYSTTQLNLKSVDRKNDTLVIVVVLAIESAFQFLVARPEIFGLDARQLALGPALTFLLYLAGAVLPAMIFIYAILVPRYLALTGSTASTVILGGLTYTLLHVWDAWTVFGSPASTVLSAIFLLMTYFGPGMIKTFLTVRTGNAWVHVWAYHALAPHILLDTPHIVKVFKIT
jgi:xanthosine utilization system XapX-like protein